MDNEKLPITLICVVRDDAAGLRRMIDSVKSFVDEIIVTVQPSTDGTLAVAKEHADTVIETDQTFYIETHFEDMISRARNELILNLDADETLERPEALADIIKIDADIWWMHRVDYLNGNRVQFITDDAHPRLHRRGSLRWHRKMHTYPDQLSEKFIDVRECWIAHRRDIEHIRLRQAQYADNARLNGEADRVVPMQNAFMQKAEDRYFRLRSGNYPRRILLSYNGAIGIGDTLMTTPAVRELRRLYPRAEITYLTQMGFVLKNNPYIDRIDSTKPENWRAENEDKFDIVVHWEGSLVGSAGYRLNGYECESYYAFVEPDSYKPDWFITRSEDKAADNFLRQNVKTPRVVGMALSASCLHRTWQHSEEFVEALLSKYEDITLIFFGDSKCQLLEMDKSSRPWQVIDAWGVKHWVQVAYDGPGADRIIRTSGRLPIREVAAIVSKLDLLIAPDSGLMHVAGALDVPTVAYFNLVPSGIRVKHMPQVKPISADYVCSPCFVHGTIACDKTTELGAPCLNTITIDRVLAAVEEVLG